MPDRIYYSDEARRYALRQRIVTAVFAFSLGMGIGALLALLFAPETGEDTRQMITDSLEEGYQRGRTAMREMEHEMAGSNGSPRQTRISSSY